MRDKPEKIMFKVFDWAGNEVNTGGKTFDTFDDGWAWIRANVRDENNAYDDLFVLECDSSGKPLEDIGNHLEKHPLISDLPEDEQEPFGKWLGGQTVPSPNGYYQDDYDRWKAGLPIVD